MSRGTDSNPIGPSDDEVRVQFDSDSKIALGRLANAHGMNLAEYVRGVLHHHIYVERRQLRIALGHEKATE